MEVDLFDAIAQNDVHALLTIFDESCENNQVIENIPEGSKVYGKSPIPIASVAAAFGAIDIMIALNDVGVPMDQVDGAGNTAFHAAASSGNIDIAEFLCTLGESCKTANKDGVLPIHVATTLGHIEFVDYLIDKGVSVSATDNRHRTPLYLAASSGNIEMIEMLLERGALPTEQDILGNSVIHAAILNKQIEAVQFIIENSQFPKNLPNLRLQTILHFAASTGDVAMVEALVDMGCNPSLLDIDKKNILHYAAESKCVEMVNFILANDSSLAEGHDSKYMTPLHYAAMYGPLESFNALLEASPNLINDGECNEPPIFLAIKHYHCDIVTRILEYEGFSPVACNKHFQTPLHVAARLPSRDSLLTLLQSELFDTEIPDRIGWTALHYAASHGALESVVALLEAGADATSKGDFDITPIDLAERRGATRILKALQESVYSEEEGN